MICIRLYLHAIQLKIEVDSVQGNRRKPKSEKKCFSTFQRIHFLVKGNQNVDIFILENQFLFFSLLSIVFTFTKNKYLIRNGINFCIFRFAGLHLRSIEEPHNRMPAEQGGTTGLDNTGSRTGVPLPLSLPSNQQPSYELDAECSRMESWMDENPEFIQDYFIR